MSIEASTPSPRDAGRRHHFQELESLRGLAALLVVFYHLPAWVPLLESPASSAMAI